MALTDVDSPSLTLDVPRLAADLVQTDGWRLLDDLGRVWELGSLPRSIGRLLRRCNGERPLAHLIDEVPTDLRDEATSLVQALHEAGLMVESRPRVRIALIGSGRLAQHIARALCSLGPTRLLLIDVQPPEQAIYPRNALPTGAAALQKWLRPQVGFDHDVIVGGHWAEIEADDIDMVVVAGATVTVDRAITEHLSRTGLPHLLVAQHRDTASVGPLVQPGDTPCVRCGDLARAETDPAWPAALLALSAARAEPHPLLLRWAADQAALLVTTWTRVRQGGATATVWSTSGTHGPRRSEWLEHPECECLSQRWLQAS